MPLVTRESVQLRTAQRGRPGWWWRFLGLGAPASRPSRPHQPDQAAEDRALELLKTHLSPEQRRHYERHGYFTVIGGTTRRPYRILHGRQMNVEVLDNHGHWMTCLCFTPNGYLPTGDVMLAQKLTLELFEIDALRVANRTWAP